MSDKEKQINAMRKMGMSEDEIKELIEYDKRVERGEDDYKLTPEQEKVSRDSRRTGTRKVPTVYKLDNTGGKRSRKENPTKGGIIAELAKFLTENSEYAVENLEIANKERLITFKIGGESFDLTLIQKRKAKK